MRPRTVSCRDAGRTLFSVAVAACALALATACDPVSAPLVSHTAAFQPVDDGGLAVWPGQDCPGVQKIRVEIEEAEDQPQDIWVLRSERKSGAMFTGLTFGEVPDGFEVSREWSDGPSWSDAKTVVIGVFTDGGQSFSYVSVDIMLEDADEHGEDEYYVENEGWFTQDEFRALVADDEGVAPLCGPGTPAS